MRVWMKIAIWGLMSGSVIGCGTSSSKEGDGSESPTQVPDPALSEDSETTQEPDPAAEEEEGSSQLDANIGENSLSLAPLPASGVPTGYASWADLEAPGHEQRSWQVLDGYDQVQELLGNRVPCSIYILAAYLDEKGHPTYLVKTSFSHVGDTHSHLKVTLSDALALSARGEDSQAQNQIFFKLARGGDLLAATQMNIKWFHINHFDTGICTSLVLRKKA